jgi:hypothetical protein
VLAGLPPYQPVEAVPEPDSERSAAVRAAVRTRLALQSTAALALAFTAGQLAFGRHWPWVVITVHAVSLRATSRGEVAVTTAERLLGALAGTGGGDRGGRAGDAGPGPGRAADPGCARRRDGPAPVRIRLVGGGDDRVAEPALRAAR